jgi:hypothetical protein
LVAVLWVLLTQPLAERGKRIRASALLQAADGRRAPVGDNPRDGKAVRDEACCGPSRQGEFLLSSSLLAAWQRFR